MKTLYYTDPQPGAKGFGWATCNSALKFELAQHFGMTRPAPGQTEFDGAVFMPIANHELEPCSPARGKINIGYAFFEYPLGDKAVENAKRYDTIFVGSSWCLDRLWERGIENGKVLVQGVDYSVFRPGMGIMEEAKVDRVTGLKIGKKQQFRIFSGGKFEWRKGQDLVIRAFAEFAAKHPDAHLVCSWFNPWPGLIGDMVSRTGPHFYYKGASEDAPKRYTQEDFFTDTILANRIPSDRFTILPQLDQRALAAEMQNTDVGLFPNRCEGGTNLVLMEYAACGGKVVANVKTGHKDVATLIDIAIMCEEDAAHWADQKVAAIVDALELAYNTRDIPISRAVKPQWTWAQAAKTIAEEVARLSERE